MRLTTFAAAAFLTLLTFATPALADPVGNVTVDNSVPSAAAGARTVYRISFTTSQAGALSGSDQIHVTLPGGTAVNGWNSGTVRAGTTDVGTCSVPNADLTSTCGLFSGASIKPGAQVVLILRGLVNGTAGADKTARVDTSKDTSATSKPFSIVDGGSVTTPTVDISSPSSAAGARTRYVVGFKVSGTGGMSADADSQIEVGLPLDTGLDGWVGGVVHDVTRDVDVGSCAKPTGRIPVSTCGFFSGASVAPGAELRVTLRGLANGEPGAETVSVRTTSDLPLVESGPFEIGKGQQVAQPSVAIDDPSAAGGARTRYLVDFKLSSGGGMSAEADSEITLTLPSGTGTAGWLGGTVTDTGAKDDVGSCTKPDAKLIVTCGFFSGASVSGGAQLRVTLRGLENGDPGVGRTVTVRTTSDLPTVTSSGFDIVKGGSVSTPTVSIADPSAAAGARTRYVIGFTLSATGGMSSDANSRITLTLPGDTSSAGWLGGTVRDVTAGGGDVGSCDKPDGQGVTTCGFFSGRSVAAGHALQITLRGLENGAAGAGKTVTVSTTSDLPTRTSEGFEVLKGLQITQPSVAIDNPSPAENARTRYVIRFALSATGGMSAEANSRITLTLPRDTGTAGWLGGTVRDVGAGRDVGSCTIPNGQLVSTCGFFSGAAVAPGASLELTLRGLSNGAAGAGKTVTVSTTSDLPTRTSSGFEVVAGNVLTGVAVTVGSTAPLASTSYSVALTTSATGGLSSDAKSELTLTFPAGTGFAGFQSGTILDVDRAVNVGSCGSPSGLVITCGLFSGAFVSGGDRLRISFPSITNPATPGPYTLTAATTSDTAAVTSTAYATPAAPETTIDDGPSGAIGNSAPTFRFSSSASGSTFECRVDAASYTSCTSPYTTPALSDGSHTFAVRATSPAGVVDPTPAAQTFTVDTAAPAAPAITSPADGSSQSSTTVELSGTGEPGATIQILEGSAPLGTAFAGGDGRWSRTLPSVAEGTHTYTARATDAAGNISPLSAPRTITVDPTAPAAPVIEAPAEGATLSSSPVELSGTAEAGLTVEIREDNQVLASPKAVDGAWSASLPAGDGSHTYAVRAVDVAGNHSTDVMRTITVDTEAPDPTIDEGPSGETTATTASFEFSAEDGTAFECRLEGPAGSGGFAACTSPRSFDGLTPGNYTFSVRARDAAGNETTRSRSFTVAPTQQQSPPDQQQPPPPPPPTPTPTPTPTVTPTPTPTFQQTVVAKPVRGTVRVKLRGSKQFVELDATQGVPFGATLDTKKGAIELTSLSKAGAAPQTATFSEGIFKVTQKGSYTNLTLNEPMTCGKKAKKATAAAAKKKKVSKRRLWGSGKGKFRTVGRYSAATVRGTHWLVQDTCTTTVTRVKQGVVSVRDKVKRKTITLRKGKRYTARKRR